MLIEWISIHKRGSAGAAEMLGLDGTNFGEAGRTNGNARHIPKRFLA
jgi:hypothetical protein